MKLLGLNIKFIQIRFCGEELRKVIVVDTQEYKNAVSQLCKEVDMYLHQYEIYKRWEVM